MSDQSFLHVCVLGKVVAGDIPIKVNFFKHVCGEGAVLWWDTGILQNTLLVTCGPHD
jgi:hypothetical protein